MKRSEDFVLILVSAQSLLVTDSGAVGGQQGRYFGRVKLATILGLDAFQLANAESVKQGKFQIVTPFAQAIEPCAAKIGIFPAQFINVLVGTLALRAAADTFELSAKTARNGSRQAGVFRPRAAKPGDDFAMMRCPC